MHRFHVNSSLFGLNKQLFVKENFFTNIFLTTLQNNKIDFGNQKERNMEKGTWSRVCSVMYKDVTWQTIYNALKNCNY